MNKSDLSVDLLRAACQRKDYAFFENHEFNLNIIGIRSRDMSTNTFNDLMTVSFKHNGQWVLFVFDCTTDPGQYWLENPMNVQGTAILVPGQYRGAYKLGLHKGKWPALVQNGRLPVYRDSNLDEVVDVVWPAIEYGYQGLNIHAASKTGRSIRVDKWSAGCQVLAEVSDHNFLIALCKKAAALYGDSFTYTLLEEADLVSA